MLMAKLYAINYDLMLQKSLVVSPTKHVQYLIRLLLIVGLVRHLFDHLNTLEVALKLWDQRKVNETVMGFSILEVRFIAEWS